MQDYALVEDFTVLDNVLLPLNLAKNKRKNRKQLAMEALEKVEMTDFAKKKVAELSGGQKQRTAIARSIVNNPDVLLADEPTGALDSANAQTVMELFRKINVSGTTIIIVTHDEDLAQCCNRIIEIKDGKIAKDTMTAASRQMLHERRTYETIYHLFPANLYTPPIRMYTHQFKYFE